MIPHVKVKHIAPSGAVFDLENYLVSMAVSKGAEATKNTITLDLINPINVLTPDNEPNQLTIDQSTITVFLSWNEIDVDNDDPIISSTISSIQYPMDANGKYKIKLKGTDKTGLLLSKLWAIAYTDSENNDAPTTIINLIGHLNDMDQTETTNVTTNNVSVVRSDGSAFPSPVVISKIWKPGYEWLNDLSQPEYTGEALPYVYYIDANNDLHWNYPHQKPVTYLTSDINTVDTIISVQSTNEYPSVGYLTIEDEVITYTGKTSTTFTGCTRGSFGTTATSHSSGTGISGLILYPGKQDIYALRISTAEDATYNFIIFNGGETPDGYELLDYSLDFSQAGKKFRMKFFDWKNEGETMTSDEKARTEWGTDKSSSYPKPGDSALSGGNPYTPLWSSTAVTSNSAYQESFVAELTRRCGARASKYFVNGKQKFAAECEMRGTKNYDVNDLVKVYSPKFNQILLLRVKDVRHQLSKASWTTTITLEQDPEVLTQ